MEGHPGNTLDVREKVNIPPDLIRTALRGEGLGEHGTYFLTTHGGESHVTGPAKALSLQLHTRQAEKLREAADQVRLVSGPVQGSTGLRKQDWLHSSARVSSFLLAGQGHSRALAKKRKATWHCRKNWPVESERPELWY